MAFHMKRIQLLKPYRAYSRGRVVEVTDDLAAHLVDSGLAVINQQTELQPAARGEAAILSQDTRRAVVNFNR